MERFKICPVCGAHNAPDLPECTECEADLISVATVSAAAAESASATAATPTPAPAPAPAPVTPAAEFVRICDCGRRNPVSARKCIACGEPIFDIAPVPVVQEARWELAAVPEGCVFAVELPRMIIGRHAALQSFLAPKVYVGREHAELFLEEGTLYVRHLNRTNPTFVNGERVCAEPVPLSDGDLLMLGGAMSPEGTMQPQAVCFRIRRL